MLKSILALSYLCILTAFGATAAMATPAPNLSVLAWQGNANPTVESPYQYTSRVQNIGNQAAQGVTMTIDFPLTATSPNKYILGKLSAVQPNGGTCSTANNKITCNFGTLTNNQTKSVTFTFEFQVATTAPIITSTVAATLSNNEQNHGNNTLAFSPTITYPIHTMGQGTYLVSSCTGRGLTSYYECEMSPGSIQSLLSLDFYVGGIVAVTGNPSYTGNWDQIALPDKSLHFTITGNIDFNGFAVSQNCFKGITTFPGNATYNSAYRVCRQ